MTTSKRFRTAAIRFLVCAAALVCAARADSQRPSGHRTHVSVVGAGWASSSVNAVIFRTNSVVSHGDQQYTAYYDDSARVVLAKRRIGTDRWEQRTTSFTNNVSDAHNAIVLGVDGRGVLHVAWAEHARALHYARGVAPGSLELGASQQMTGQHEAQVTYPQMYTLRSGDLLFVYRDGQSGRGDVMLNRWDVKRGAWMALAHPLISGEGARNAYMNTVAVDAHGGWHLSWVWRETPDVATNHDVLYAFSPDEGLTWMKTTGEKYALPITESSAEVAWAVPQGQELINQTTMTVDPRGRPIIATYFRPEGSDVPQLQLVWRDRDGWRASQVAARREPFRLSGGGTKRIPLSRPLVVSAANGAVHVIFRDVERGGGISVASASSAGGVWRVSSIWPASVGQWEPTHDPITWQRRGALHLFVQRVGQGDAETLEPMPAQPVSILEWHPR